MRHWQLLGTVLEKPAASEADWQGVATVRQGVFGLVWRQGFIGLIQAGNEQHHELPGGLVEAGESLSLAFGREIGEELGLAISKPRALAVIREIWFSRGIETFSHVMIAEATGQPQPVTLTPKEIKRGLTVKWLTLEAVETLVRNEQPALASGRMKHGRDVLALDFFREHPEILKDYKIR